MTLIRLCVDAINRLARLKRRPDQTSNAMMKTSIFGSSFGILVSVLIGTVQARDDGRYSQSPLKPWFDNLRSGKGPRCSDADGFAIADPDWESKSGHNRVRIDEWVDVPDDAVITEPNRAGRTMVWPVKGTFNSLLHAGQYDMIPALAFSGLVRFRGRVTLSITIATARGIGQ